MGFPLSLGHVDARTNEVHVNSETYRKLFELASRIYSIPGNKPPQWGYNAYDAFIKDQNVAMSANVNMLPYIAQVPEFDWDLAQYPSYQELPNVYGMFDSVLRSQFNQFMDEEKDLNTALRDAEEEIIKHIEADFSN